MQGLDLPGLLLELQRWVVTWADISAIRQAQRRRDRALAFVSHDLRGPAQAIVLLASLHREGRLQMPQDELLAEVQRQASRTLQLAEDFVRVADVESRPLQLQPMDPGVLLGEVAADFHPQALDAGLTLQVLPPRHPRAERADRTDRPAALAAGCGPAAPRPGQPGFQCPATRPERQHRHPGGRTRPPG
ncbi:MAG: HAMP domain-containing histidine kinase [Burkholderiales bacterium]|nr:HAMP domain-containing histidine kinase [Burkholderiales bacterium]